MRLPDDIERRLGQEPDASIARDLGVTGERIRQHRADRGIPAYKRSGPQVRSADPIDRQALNRQLGARIAARRGALGYSPTELTDASGTGHRSWIRRVERGDLSIRVDNLFRLAHGLQCRPADLLPDPEDVAMGGSNDG